MTPKRITILLTIVVATYLLFILGKGLLFSYYRQKADVALFFSGDYKKAIKYYNILIFWHPESAGYYYNRGDAYYGDGQNEKAISDYNKSLQLGIEDSLQTVLRIALAAKQQGNFQTEEQYLQKLHNLSIDKQENKNEFWAANYHLGQLEFKKKNYRKSIDYYNVAHAVQPTNLEIYHRANAYYALGLVDSARQDLQQSLLFVKAEFVKKNPESILAKCDTCSFPFGTDEYAMLTQPLTETIIQTLNKFTADKKTNEFNYRLKSTEKNSR